nr:immunoglobulin heavy chain junction region [Macaca mulatta]MOY17934.1 immunoglobulin heavy chain junction region [Macaca mulatta]MOY17946.1 immunoglobulin heavy chain junction region [Macaca mulatta]MOY17978.1 immunoglobulin heavy chain junction region [Macaca mulatta]MOY18036.1 immunoglobulin heavy chain junction region [Macaca mulatta]
CARGDTSGWPEYYYGLDSW